MNIIGTRIKELRLEKELTQSKLARELNISQDTVSLWELGKSAPDAFMLIKLSKLFKVRVDYILGLED